LFARISEFLLNWFNFGFAGKSDVKNRLLQWAALTVEYHTSKFYPMMKWQPNTRFCFQSSSKNIGVTNSVTWVALNSQEGGMWPAGQFSILLDQGWENYGPRAA